MEPNIPKDIDPYLKSEQYERESWKNMGKRLYIDVKELLEKEGQLIRAEINEKIIEVKMGVISLATAGVVFFAGIICFAATAIILLDMVTSLWLASTIVTILLLVTGFIMLGAAKKRLGPQHLKPERSIEALGEIRHSLKEKVNEITKH